MHLRRRYAVAWVGRRRDLRATGEPTPLGRTAPRTAARLVTGASSGIGAATALRLAAAGAHVVLAARRLDRLEALAAGIAGQGGSASALPLDVAHDADVAAAAGTLRDRHGRLDILVNAAGVMLLSPVAEADPAEWRRMVEINLIGLMQVTRAVLPLMPSGHGHVVNIASLAGRIANPGASEAMPPPSSAWWPSPNRCGASSSAGASASPWSSPAWW